MRYDCSHGFFHRDILTPKGEKIKQAIPLNNLKDALTYAKQDIKDCTLNMRVLIPKKLNFISI